MGYFSELDIENRENYRDESYRSFDEQLAWRYEELQDRYEELLGKGTPAVGEDRFSKNDYLYASVKCLRSLSDVYHAMEAVKEALGISSDAILNGGFDSLPSEDVNPDQISFFEVLVLPSWQGSPAAA